MFFDEIEMSEMSIDPFKINFVTLHDYNNTKIGFEFVYNGTQPALNKDKLDLLLMKIHEQNSSKLQYFDNSVDGCPLFDEYLHNNYKIEVYEETCIRSGSIQYRIKVITDYSIRENDWIKVCVSFLSWNRMDRKFESPGKLTYWPGYLIKYVLNLSHEIEDILCNKKAN